MRVARNALIAGAGVAGLASAIALTKQGFSVRLWDKAPALQEVGAGLQLAPNAMRALARLGALDAVKADVMYALRVLRGRDEAELCTLDLSAAQARWGAPYCVIHRADLQQALLTLCEPAPVLGAEVLDFNADSAGVTIQLPHGQERGDFLLGADGCRSKIRFYDNKLPRIVPYVVFRALVPTISRSMRAAVVTLRLGEGTHLVQYPLRQGTLLNLVAVVENRPGGVDLLQAFSGWHRSTRDWIASIYTWQEWPLFVHPPLMSYTQGRVALVGDAAHPMLPFLAQGAAQALEDAVALGQAFRQHEEVAVALAAYSRVRVARAHRVQRAAAEQGRVDHLGGVAALARDVALRAFTQTQLLQRYDWLYG